MGKRIIKTAFRVGTFLSIVYFLRGCYLEKQDTRIEPVNQPTTWVYDMFTPIIGERGYYVLLDGELDQEASLETSHQVTTSRHKRQDTTFTGAGPYASMYATYPTPNYTSHVVKLPDSTYTLSYRLKLPKGKFSLYYNRDDSGAETFTYHPGKASRGWLRIQIEPGVWNWDHKDSTRTNPEYLPIIHKPNL